MRIENVELSNMRTFASASYKVPTGLSLVTGQNGTGKSTLLGIAAAWAMWGQTPGRTQDFLVRHGEREMNAKVTFSGSAGTKYQILRQFKLNKNGKGGVTQLLFHADNLLGDPGEAKWSDLTAATVRETQARINDIAGTFEVWQMTAYVGQREGAGQFLQANAYDRKGILREIIAGAGDWDEWEVFAKKWVKHHEGKMLSCKGAIPVLEGQAEPFDKLTQALEAARQTTAQANSLATESTENLRLQNEAHTRGQEVGKQWESWDTQLATLEERKTETEARIEALKGDIEQLESLAGQSEKNEAEYEAHQLRIAERQAEIDKVRAENDEAREKNHEQNEAYTLAMAEWNVERGDWQKSRDEKMALMKADVELCAKVELAVESLEDNFCQECKQPLTSDHTAELEKLVADNADWKDRAYVSGANYDSLKREQPPAAPMPPNPFSVAELPQALGQDEQIITLRTRIAGAAEQKVKDQASIETLETQLKSIGVDAQRIKKDASTAERPEPDYLEKLSQALEIALDRDRKARAAVAQGNTNIALAEQGLAAAQKAKDSLDEQRKALDTHKVELFEWETVAQMCGTNGVRQLIIDQALAQLEPACNRWLEIIAPGFEIAFSTQTDTNQETFEEGVILPTGAIQPWSELSGAQSVAVALAVRLGLAEVGGAAQGVHYETLYLDEADAWLTGNYQQQFMNMLSRVADTGIDVVAITHIDAVKEMVDQQVEVVANGDGSSRLK